MSVEGARAAEPVRCEIEAGVAYLRLSVPASDNALTTSLLEGLSRSLERATSDPSCRAAVISAEGEHFCRGLDLEAAFTDDGGPDERFLRLSIECLSGIRAARFPVIACVEGHVTGGGLGLVAACDIVIAAPQVVFMLPEVIVGMMPALIAPFLLRRLTPARLGYLAQSSRGIQGAEAHAYGLVDEIAEGEVGAAVNRQLKRILRSSPAALAESKRYFDALTGGDFTRQTEAALSQLRTWLRQPGVAEGARAFAEGGAPPWAQKHVTRKHF